MNPEAHFRTTGPELWEQTGGKITALVGGMGTGGTMTRRLTVPEGEEPARSGSIGADPVGSILKHLKETGEVIAGQPYKVEGIGGDKLAGTLDLDVIDEIRTVSDKEAFLMTRRLAREEGLFVGGSSGLATRGRARGRARARRPRRDGRGDPRRHRRALPVARSTATSG